MNKLSQLPEGSNVFIDTNIFVYAVLDHYIYGKECLSFLKKIENNHFQAFTTTAVLGEVFHSILIQEIAEKESMPIQNVVRTIKQRPELISSSTLAWQAIEDIRSLTGLTIIGITTRNFIEATFYSKTYNLLITDALHVASTRELEIANFATNDPDFERVPFLNIYKP